MTVQQAEFILVDVNIKIAYQHRFAGDRGTVLRLENYAMINIYDDGRYYIQGDDVDELRKMFAGVEEPWDPETWDPHGPDTVLPVIPPKQKPVSPREAQEQKPRFNPFESGEN